MLSALASTAKRVARMDGREDRIDPWLTTLEPLPPFPAQIAPTKMNDNVDPWNGQPVQNTRVQLAIDTTDPWQE